MIMAPTAGAKMPSKTIGRYTGKEVVRTNKVQREALLWVANGACGITIKKRFEPVLPVLREKGLTYWEAEFQTLVPTDMGTDVLFAAGLVR